MPWSITSFQGSNMYWDWGFVASWGFFWRHTWKKRNFLDVLFLLNWLQLFFHNSCLWILFFCSREKGNFKEHLSLYWKSANRFSWVTVKRLREERLEGNLSPSRKIVPTEMDALLALLLILARKHFSLDKEGRTFSLRTFAFHKFLVGFSASYKTSNYLSL